MVLGFAGCIRKYFYKKVCEYTSMCQRQMERLFMQNIGISIKRTADLVRYQNVLQDLQGILQPGRLRQCAFAATMKLVRKKRGEK